MRFCFLCLFWNHDIIREAKKLNDSGNCLLWTDYKNFFFRTRTEVKTTEKWKTWKSIFPPKKAHKKPQISLEMFEITTFWAMLTHKWAWERHKCNRIRQNRIACRVFVCVQKIFVVPTPKIKRDKEMSKWRALSVKAFPFRSSFLYFRLSFLLI